MSCARLDTVERARQKAGIGYDAATEPDEIRAILKEMHLNTLATGNKHLAAFLKQATTAPQPLAPMLETTVLGLADNPAIVDFLDLSLKNNWITLSDYQVKRTLHVMYLLEGLTLIAANDAGVLQDLQKHFSKELQAYGIKPASTLSKFLQTWKHSKDFFLAIKAISVDPAITATLFSNQNNGKPPTEEDIKALVKKGLLSFADQQTLKMYSKPGAESDFSGLMINILEAGSTELKKGYDGNARAAIALNAWIKSQNPSSLTQNRKVVPNFIEEQPADSLYRTLPPHGMYYGQSTLSLPWEQLYESWNLSFVLSQFNDLETLLPKLLIPSVLAATPGEYIHTRTMALWLAIQHFTFRRIDGITPVTSVSEASRREMAEAFGRINAKYAQQLAQESKFTPLLNKDWGTFSKNPNAALMKAIFAFSCN